MSKVWTFDYDETITAAPKRCRRIAQGLRALGDKIIVVTGNPSDRDKLIKALNDYKFPFDDLIQYNDEESFGLRRADILRELDAYGAFDDRAGRAVTLADVCPHFFVAAQPPKDAEDAADGGKKDAKKVVKDAVRSERVSDRLPTWEAWVPSGWRGRDAADAASTSDSALGG
jgi:hypothetical protein